MRQLIAQGHEPVVLDNLSYGHMQALPEGIAFYKGELADAELLGRIFKTEKIELVMHFAAFINVGESVTDPLKYYKNNLADVIVLLKAMLEHGVKKFVFSSTCAIYGLPKTLPLSEDLPRAPINPYGQTKLDVETVLQDCVKAHGLSACALRYFNASGANEKGDIGEDHKPETHLIPLAIYAAMGKGKPLAVFGDDYHTPDGTCLRDYIHVDDLCRAHILAFDKLKEPGVFVDYNLGKGKPFSVLEVIKGVEAVSGLKVPYSIGPRRAGDPDALYADSSKAVRELNWQIQYTQLNDIIASAWQWHSTHLDGYGA